MEWKNIEEEQPSIYHNVLFWCGPGGAKTGKYFGKEYFTATNQKAPTRKPYGKHGRYCEPCVEGWHKVTHWQELPNGPAA